MSKMNANENEHFEELDLTSKNTNFVDLKRCFKMCVKDMSKAYLDEKEDICSSLK